MYIIYYLSTGICLRFIAGSFTMGSPFFLLPTVKIQIFPDRMVNLNINGDNTGTFRIQIPSDPWVLEPNPWVL
jgi:hypothetical protein